jgi:hypothetical protein
VDQSAPNPFANRFATQRFRLIADDCDTLRPSLARIPRASTMTLKRRPRSD